jgi:hypothetical protein
MANEPLNADKLREYLKVLKPEARALLMAELERGVLRGEGMPGTNLILEELRNTLTPSQKGAPPQQGAAPQKGAPAAQVAKPERVGNPSRLFFTPVEPFLVDDSPEFTHQGRISRACLTAIWDWICRDLAPAEAKAYAETVTQHLLAEQEADADAAARAFQDRVIQLIQAAMGAARADDKAKRRLAVQIGTPRAIEDVHRLATILRVREPLAAVAGRLPSHIKNLSDDQLAGIKSLLDATTSQRDLFTFAAVLVMNRLQSPWQLIRFAVKAANTDDPARIADTTYAFTVNIVLEELERLVRLLASDLRRGQAMARPTLIKDIHDFARGLRSEMDLSGDTPWARRLAAVRGDVANLLKGELESVPGRVRRLLRMRPSRDVVPGTTLDQTEVEDTETLIAFLGTCRNFASELAINEMTLRAWSETQHYLETNIQGLIEALRTASNSDRTYRQSVVDAAVRFCGKVFGNDYAALLSKAADLAGNGERKAAAKG